MVGGLVLPGLVGLVWLLPLPAAVAGYAVSEQQYEAVDVARNGRRVTATLYLAIGQLSPTPVVAFAHGFGLGAGDYPLAKELTARRGMVVFLPHDLGVFPSTKNLALDQIFLLAHAVKQSSNYSSPLFGRVANKTLLAGHSLGGGSTILAADAELAAAYPPPTALATVSLGTYTIPGALSSAPKVPPTLPALLMTATEDCIDPPAKNSMPVFAQLKSGCAFVASIVGGSHCQYAAQSIGCSTTEKLCGAKPNISRDEQTERALEVLLPFIDAALSDGSTAWSSFDQTLGAAAAAGRLRIMAERTQGCGKLVLPSSTSPRVVDGPEDATFAAACQRRVARDYEGVGVQLLIEEQSLAANGFLTTKPSLTEDSAHVHVNVTMITHVETTLPFSHSLAIKMKSAEAISTGKLMDNVTCADLHTLSLETALSEMSPEERQAYGIRTKSLRFGEDAIWRTGLWVALAKLQVTDSDKEVTVVAPRFHAPVKGLPERWGGVVYCRLLPPSAIRDWIRGQLVQTMVV